MPLYSDSSVKASLISQKNEIDEVPHLNFSSFNFGAEDKSPRISLNSGLDKSKKSDTKRNIAAIIREELEKQNGESSVLNFMQNNFGMNAESRSRMLDTPLNMNEMKDVFDDFLKNQTSMNEETALNQLNDILQKQREDCSKNNNQ